MRAIVLTVWANCCASRSLGTDHQGPFCHLAKAQAMAATIRQSAAGASPTRGSDGNLAATAEIKICVMRLARIGDAEGETVETQHRATMPEVGDVIDVTVDGMPVRARVTRISSPSPGAEGHFTIDVDELSSGYLLETLSALAQSDDGKLSSDELSSMKPTKPHSALGATLKLARQCHALTRQALDRPKPDLAVALRYMQAARRAGCLAAPYLQDEELLRRIVGYKPMSDEEWERLWPSHLQDWK
jgi:hypothetical protein